ncbi:unnamed protein product [Rhizophagus irregularis]|nr:unnamed protein product [Rhizophagus irregularis]
MDFPKEYFKIRSGGLLKNGKPKDSFGRASEERKPKIHVQCLGRASEERKNPKIHDRVGFRPSGKEELRFDRVGFRPSGKEEPRFDRVGFRPSGKEEPRFDRVGFRPSGKRNQDSIGWASDLQEKRNQDSIEWASDLREKRNQDSLRVGFRSSEKVEPRFVSGVSGVFQRTEKTKDS